LTTSTRHRAVAAAFLLAAACSSSAGSRPHIRLTVPTDNSSSAYVEVTGLSNDTLDAIGRFCSTREKCAQVLRVVVKLGEDLSVPMVGRYAVEQRALRFTPMFPLDAGREYEVFFDPAVVPGADGTPMRTSLSRPAPVVASLTTVSHIYPTAETVPENQLRFYIHFSAPMGRRGGLDYIQLLDESGRAVEDPFLPLDTDLWNEDRTRYTVFFDPGRQKRGILPNRAMGPSLTAGRTYTLVVKRDWTDGNGQPLKETSTRQFRVGPPDLAPLDHRAWKIDPPLAGTLSPVVVSFPEPLDHGLLLRALAVRRGPTGIPGQARVEAGETRWAFTPGEPWEPGEYALMVLSVLEDLAGNRIGRAFEVDRFERIDRLSVPESFTLPFQVPWGRRGTE
jgi:hypothetical protein